MTLPELNPAQQEQLLRFRKLEQTITQVWKSVGTVMFPKKAEEMLKELTNRGELLEIQRKGLDSREKENVANFEELQKRLSQDLGDSTSSN
jgi:chaperonin cofactor prefoldin